MTPDQLDENASKAHDFVHALVTPLIGRDPTGIGIKVRETEILLFSSPQNMGALIGKGGTMVRALRQLVMPFGWRLEVPSQARHDLATPPLEPAPSVRDIAIGWLDARYGPEAYRLVGEPEGQSWQVFVHPDHFHEADFSALDNWAYGAARATGDFLKIRIKAGGIARTAA